MDGIVNFNDDGKIDQVDLKVIGASKESLDKVIRYMSLIDKMVAKNSGNLFSNGSRFATVGGIAWLRGSVHPSFVFKGIDDRVECFRCREAK